MNINGTYVRRFFSMGVGILVLFTQIVTPSPVLADHTPNPTSVTIAGSLQSELGCPGDWDPACAATHLAYDAGDDVWQGTFNIPAGSWEYKAPLNDSWDENYGDKNGNNIALNLGAPANVKFYYDHKSHWLTDNVNDRIVTAAGSFQSEIGCPGDWDPTCLRSWLQDKDDDGTYTFTTTDIPAGNYEFKAVINEDWSESYGQGGDNYPFTVPGSGYIVTFSFVSATNTPSVEVVSSGPKLDNNVEWAGLRHDSRDTLYRTPGGAVPAGTEVLVRFRTFHNDVTGVSLRIYDLNANGQQIIPMTPAATDVSCYEAGLEDSSCDFWQAAVNEASPNNLWYRFIITDGTDTDYYADNTAALDGGLGVVSDDAVDQSYARMFHDQSFTAPAWDARASI
jgi:hypothetical protein